MDQLVTSLSKNWTSKQADTEGNNNPLPFEILYPKHQTVPLVFASPHSGRDYPAHFVEASRLDPLMLRRSEDSFVDDLFSNAPALGAPLLKARFPRAYLDPNREAFELDPAMFDDPLPDYVNTNSVKVSAGLGTVARVVTNGEEIYGHKLKFMEAKRRVENAYFPYHAALKRLIEDTKCRFGTCLLIDCHSMPSIGSLVEDDYDDRRVDIVLGNNHGTSCAPEILSYVNDSLRRQGMAVFCNNPYSGGYTTRHYGQPDEDIHALQVEINRSLYMEEKTIERHGGFLELCNRITRLIVDLSKFQF